MKFWEAMKALEEGKKITCLEWAGTSGDYIDKERLLANDYAYEGPFSHWQSEWELYEEPVQTFTFIQVIQGLKEGKGFKRKSWEHPDCVLYNKNRNIFLILEDFEANDWIWVK